MPMMSMELSLRGQTAHQFLALAVGVRGQGVQRDLVLATGGL